MTQARPSPFVKRAVLLMAMGLALAVAGVWTSAQAPVRRAPAKRPPEELRRLSVAAEVPGLAEPFRGITSGGRIEPGLFAVRSTGVSTAQVRAAADAFLASLAPPCERRPPSPSTIPSGGSG